VEPSYSGLFLPVLSPMIPIFAFQIPEFLLGLRQLGRIYILQGTLLCTSTCLIYMQGLVSSGASYFLFLNLQVPFFLFCYTHLSGCLLRARHLSLLL